MPVVALGFAVGPVAGQNFGARHADRVRDTFKTEAGVAAAFMLVFVVACHFAAAAMIGFSRPIPAVYLSRLPEFELRWIWYLSVFAVLLQVTLQLLLLRREFRVRLGALAATAPAV